MNLHTDFLPISYRLKILNSNENKPALLIWSEFVANFFMMIEI